MSLNWRQNHQVRRSLQNYLTMSNQYPFLHNLVQTFTLTAKMGLYCQKQVDRVIFQTLFSIGSLIGLLCMNTLADTKGRRFSTLLSIAIAMIAILCESYFNLR